MSLLSRLVNSSVVLVTGEDYYCSSSLFLLYWYMCWSFLW